jgi:hypothetical protein
MVPSPLTGSSPRAPQPSQPISRRGRAVDDDKEQNMASEYDITVVDNPHGDGYIGVLRITREDGSQIEQGYPGQTRSEARGEAKAAKKQDKVEQAELVND